MSEQRVTYGIQKFAKYSGFAVSLGVIGFCIAIFGFVNNDNVSQRLGKVETRVNVVNPCSIKVKVASTKHNDKAISTNPVLANREACRKGLALLIRKTSNDPERAIEALGLNDK